MMKCDVLFLFVSDYDAMMMVGAVLYGREIKDESIWRCFVYFVSDWGTMYGMKNECVTC